MKQNHEKPRSDSDPQQQLYEGMGFDKDDLAANRAGQLSQNQIIILNRAQGRRLVYMGILLALLVIFSGSGSSQSSLDSQLSEIFTIAIILLELLLGYRWYRNRREIINGTITSLEGTIERMRMHASGKGGGTSYTIGVSGKHFNVTRETYDAFLHDHHYRLYVTPISKQLLSAEYLD